jgi:hypothetical protein
MASREVQERRLKEIQEIAEGWGKMLAREAFPDGPGLDVTLADMEEFAIAASRALVKGAVETMTGAQGEQFGKEAPCPSCGKTCPLQTVSRAVVVHGGDTTLAEPVGDCPTCRRDFFPQRPVLKIDGHGYSPTILHRSLYLAGVINSFDVAEVALKVVGEIAISDRQINKLTTEMGEEMAADRDARTRHYVARPLPRQPTVAEVPPDLAAVFCAGGRLRTREPDQGRGIHQPHWRETKNAAFQRMESRSFDEDPPPDLPDCFRNEAYVEKLVNGLKCLKNEARQAEADPHPSAAAAASTQETSAGKSPPWQPQALLRTCLSSLASSEEFGPMMAAEASGEGDSEAVQEDLLGLVRLGDAA